MRKKAGLLLLCSLFSGCLVLSRVFAADNCERWYNRDKVRVSVLPQKKEYCAGQPVEVKVVFENTTDKDLLIVYPPSCTRSCLFFGIKNGRKQDVRPEPDKGPVVSIFETDIKLAIFKPKAKIELVRDITVQPNVKYNLEEGIYFVTAHYMCGDIWVTRDGRKTLRLNLESEPIEISIKKCPG
jgi:hypothetical protein